MSSSDFERPRSVPMPHRAGGRAPTCCAKGQRAAKIDGHTDSKGATATTSSFSQTGEIGPDVVRQRMAGSPPIFAYYVDRLWGDTARRAQHQIRRLGTNLRTPKLQTGA